MTTETAQPSAFSYRWSKVTAFLGNSRILKSSGHSSQSPPWPSFSDNRSPFNIGLAPNCFTKAGTWLSLQNVRPVRIHSISHGFATDPLSPPNITQSTPAKAASYFNPLHNGSALTHLNPSA